MSIISDSKDWLISHQRNILLLVGVLIVGAVAFESGFLRGKISQSAPLIISIPASTEPVSLGSDVPMGKENQPFATSVTLAKQTVNCPFVGSKNSNKYHLATCAVAKRIKAENRVCFSSKEDAEKRGYVAGCIK